MSFLDKIKKMFSKSDVEPSGDKKLNKKICVYCSKRGATKQFNKFFYFHKKCLKFWKKERKGKAPPKRQWT